MSMNGNGEKRGVSFEGQVELTDAIEYLKSLQAALKKGKVYVQNGSEVVALEPEQAVTMEVEARTKREKQSIKLTLRWEKVEEPAEVPTDSFVISAKEPEIPEVEVAEEE